MGSRRKLLLVLGSLAAVIVCIYLGFSFYFMSHFYSGTHINGADFSMKTAEDADKYLQKQIAGYTLTIIPKEGEKEEVGGIGNLGLLDTTWNGFARSFKNYV